MSDALDFFHVGFTVRDIRATMDELSSVLRCGWSSVSQQKLELQHNGDAINPEMTFVFSLGGNGGQIELIEHVPGTIWELPDDVDVQFNHLGYWSGDFDKDSRGLPEKGMPMLCTYDTDKSIDGFVYHRLTSGLMVELNDTAAKPNFDAWFAGSGFDSPDS